MCFNQCDKEMLSEMILYLDLNKRLEPIKTVQEENFSQNNKGTYFPSRTVCIRFPVQTRRGL